MSDPETNLGFAPMKHTPGPWKAENVDIDGFDVTRWSVLTAERDRDYFIATIENGAPGDCLRTEEANARAIAAVPELLEFVEEVAIGPYGDSDLQSLVETMQTRARAILADLHGNGTKDTGGQSQ